MTLSLRVATWNLERCSSRSWKRRPSQDRRMAEVTADIWVLTETFTDRSPGDGFVGVFSPPHPDRGPDPSERWTAIWSRWPMTPLTEPAQHRRGTVAARIDTMIGPVIVYGAVIAWAHEPSFDDGRPAGAWDVHLAEIDRQAGEWYKIRSRYPTVPLIVAGDLNQARDGRRWGYGTNATRRSLDAGLAGAGLRSLTDLDLVERGPLVQSHVEHICVSYGLDQVGPVHAWSRTNVSGTRLSDHPTIAVDLTTAPSRTIV